MASLVASRMHHDMGRAYKSFSCQVLSSSKSASLQNQTTTFSQKEDGMLYEAWDGFKDLLQLCPHHGLQRWMIVQTFYNGVTQLVRSTIDAVIGGTLMNKIKDEAYNLIQKMVLNNF